MSICIYIISIYNDNDDYEKDVSLSTHKISRCCCLSKISRMRDELFAHKMKNIITINRIFGGEMCIIALWWSKHTNLYSKVWDTCSKKKKKRRKEKQ